MEVALLYYISLYYHGETHLYHLWCSQVQVGTSSWIARCQAAGRAHTVTPTLGPCCSSTQIWWHCSCWWTTAGTSSAEPLRNSSPFGCLKEGQQFEKRSHQDLEMEKKIPLGCWSSIHLSVMFFRIGILPIHSVPVELGSKPSLHSQR